MVDPFFLATPECGCQPMIEFREEGQLVGANQMAQGLERVLFVMGESDAGKSHLLRDMFYDRRFGTGGNRLTKKKPNENYYISNERRLYLAISSPHEKRKGGETLTDFLNRCRSKTRSQERWNIACALQISQSRNTPPGPDVVDAFVKALGPERTRDVFLSPDWQRRPVDSTSWAAIVAKLNPLGVELVCADAHATNGNWQLCADFFHFV